VRLQAHIVKGRSRKALQLGAIRAAGPQNLHRNHVSAPVISTDIVPMRIESYAREVYARPTYRHSDECHAYGMTKLMIRLSLK
jgi:hypothetical protein